MKIKIIIWFIGFIFAVPVSIAGIEWAMFKYTKQLINCGEDAVKAGIKAMDLDNYANSARDVQSAGTDLFECRDKASPRESNIVFFKEELSRRSR